MFDLWLNFSSSEVQNYLCYTDLDLLLEGNSTGSVNWTHVKTNLKSVDNLMGDHDNDAVSPIVTKGKGHQSYKKHPSSAVLDTVVYGLPHITLS